MTEKKAYTKRELEKFRKIILEQIEETKDIIEYLKWVDQNANLF